MVFFIVFHLLGSVPPEDLGGDAAESSLGVGADDCLADLQPEDSEGEEDMPIRPVLTQEQQVM